MKRSTELFKQALDSDIELRAMISSANVDEATFARLTIIADLTLDAMIDTAMSYLERMRGSDEGGENEGVSP